ncbi:MAG: dihydrolipoyl dehydrogenase [Bdellovibrio sp.]|nr:MAG: dihydrolipoyl dehydrogenase [Bdellovibrio sp.]
MNMNEFDLIVIGSGPGGYIGAIRAAQLGLKTAVVEKEKTFGGTCLNIGCIPSKALLDSSEYYSMAAHKDFEKHGLEFSGLKLNLKAMMKRKEKVVEELTNGIAYLFKKNKITSLRGFGKLLSENEVSVLTEKGEEQKISAKNIVLATGSVPNELPFMPFDGKFVISSTEALSLEKVPEKMVVVGAGAIGLELGSVWMRLGSDVTVLEYQNKIAGVMDGGMSKRLLQSLKKQGMKFVLQAKVKGADAQSRKVFYELNGEEQELEADVVLVATGRKPYSEGLGLEKLGIQKNDRGFVVVDEHWRTSIPHIYAIGDLIPGPMLAHKAEEEGVAVAEIIAGKPGHVNYKTVPSVIYTWPELASVGKTEEELKAEGIPYNIGQFPFSANGRAKALGFTEGQAKILAHKETDQILGVHILGPRASDILAEAVVGMEFFASSEDIARSFHAHPTLPEVIREAALAVENRARQM